MTSKRSVSDPHAGARNAFITAFKGYCEESAIMQRLLLSLVEEPAERRLPALERQQKRVDSARQLYESARDRYMHEVLDVIVERNGSRLNSATPVI